MKIVQILDPKNTLNVIHPESALAHKYLDGLRGIEIGAASYAPFGLDTLNVSTGDPTDRARYKDIQLAVCGSFVTVDIEAEAHDLPIDSDSVDFVLASHVLEHIANPIAALVEWSRVVRSGGFLFLIVPKRLVQYGDQDREITPFRWYINAWVGNWSNEKAFQKMYDRPTPEHDRMRGHIWVFSLESLIEVVTHCYMFDEDTHWELIEAHETDDTTGEGHMAIFRCS